jgi:hypothetical protein
LREITWPERWREAQKKRNLSSPAGCYFHHQNGLFVTKISRKTVKIKLMTWLVEVA